MRPIDADELLDEICREQCELKFTDCDGMCEMAAVVVNAPTIDAAPVVHGRWAKNKYGYITCSKCNNFPLETMTGSLMTMHYEPCESKYCPHCGAKMDLEGR